MATVRIQVRRGTASQWTSANPTLAAGEMGVESDTNLFKFGNGSTAWASLAYANNSDVAIAEISQDAINNALSVGSGLTKTYDDGANTIVIAVSDAYFTELAQDAIGNSLGTGLSYNDTTGAISVNTSTIQARVANVSDTEIGYLDGVTSAIQTQINAKVNSSDIAEAAQDAMNTAFIDGDGIKKAYDDASNTMTVDLDLTTNGGLKIDASKLTLDTDVAVTKIATQTLTNKQLNNPGINDATAVTVTGTEINYLTGLTKNIATSYTDIYNDATDYTDTAIGSLGDTVSSGYVPLSLLGQAEGVAELDVNAHLPMSYFNLVDAELMGDTVVENLEISGTLIFNGTATEINSTNLSITDPLIYMGEDNPGNTLDLGIVSSFTQNSVYQHTGLVRDHATNTWVLFKGVTDEPTTTVNLAQGSLDALAVGALTATTLDVGSVSNTEISYLNGVTGGIQDQLDLKATLESPTFTGTVSLPNNTIQNQHMGDDSVGTNEIAGGAVNAEKIAAGAVTTAKIADGAVTSAKIAETTIATINLADSSVTSAKIANDTIVNADINSAAAIDWTKLGISSSVSATEAGYLDGVTSAIQTQIDSKLALAGGELTGDLTLRGNPTTNNMAATKNYVDSLVSAETTNRGTAITTEESARNTAITTAVSTHAALTASHGVTGAVVGTTNTQTLTNKTLTSPVINTPTGITKSDVGLANVDNTADTAKPVSTAQQTALDAKLASATAASTYAPLASPALTGSPTAPTATAADNSTKIATTAYADRAASNAASALVASAPGALDTLNELATALGNDASFSTTITNSIATKSPIASPTFTGTVTAPAITATALITASASGVAFTDGTQTKEGVPSRTTILSKTADYTLTALTERDNMIELNSSSPITLSVPTDATLNFPIGTTIDLLRVGTGTVTIGAVTPGTTTINATPGFKLRAQWSSATLMKRAANTWVLLGDLMA
jgi:hypothetical protein